MSADGVNSYVKKVLGPSMTLPELLASVNQQLGSAKTRGGKRILADLRELCLYAVPGQQYPSTDYAMGLLRLVEDSGDPDIDKKALRVCYFLLFEYVYSQHIRESTYTAVFTSLSSYLQGAVARLSGATLCLAWRHLGRTGRLLLSEGGRADGTYVEIVSTIHRSLKVLKYPEKKKGFLGREKVSESYETSLHMWTAVFSALRRADHAPSKECMPVVFQGCMSAHQALSRHGFALLRRAVESDPAVFCPLLLEKLESGQFFSHASIDAMNCSQLVNACRIMMTAPAATSQMISQALTVIFNLLKSPRLAIVLESVRALTEAPQAWAFKETLAELGGPSIPSRIADALLVPFGKLAIRVDRFAISEDAVTVVASDELDQSSHASPVKSAPNASTPPPKRKSTGELPLPAGAASAACIGEGDISWGPLCRACVRLGRYMVHRPPDDVDGMSAEDDPQISALLDAIKATLASLESIDAKIAALGPVDSTMHVPVASLSILPHVKCEMLKAYMWLLPENRSGSDKCVNMWAQLERTVIVSLPSLSESLMEGLISNIVARLKASKVYNKELASMVLSVTSAAIAATLATSTVLACLLTQVWDVIGDMAAKWTHASGELLASVLCCVDGTVLQNEYGVLVAPHSFSSHDMSSAQVLRGLRQHAYWMLGEYIYLWADAESLCNAYCFENVAYHGHRTAITEIMPRLLSAMWTEQGNVQLSALEAVYKIAAHAVKLSYEDPSREKFGIISFIRHEMNYFLGAIIGTDDVCSGGDWVFGLSECQRLVSLGLPTDTGTRPSLLHAVRRGQYSDDCMDISRSASAYLLALDSMWEALNNPSTEVIGRTVKNASSDIFAMQGLALAIDVGKKEDEKNEKEPAPYVLPVADVDQLEFLRLQLACHSNP